MYCFSQFNTLQILNIFNESSFFSVVLWMLYSIWLHYLSFKCY